MLTLHLDDIADLIENHSWILDVNMMTAVSAWTVERPTSNIAMHTSARVSRGVFEIMCNTPKRLPCQTGAR